MDDRGSLAPRTTAGARGAALVLGVVCFLLCSGAAWGAHHAVAAVLMRVRLRTWEREWARVEPVWSGRAG
ncbi:hypothetical protein [Streptomyces sp. NPDC001070]